MKIRVSDFRVTTFDDLDPGDAFTWTDEQDIHEIKMKVRNKSSGHVAYVYLGSGEISNLTGDSWKTVAVHRLDTAKVIADL